MCMYMTCTCAYLHPGGVHAERLEAALEVAGVSREQRSGLMSDAHCTDPLVETARWKDGRHLQPRERPEESDGLA
mgnify:CR=1 FL=1